MFKGGVSSYTVSWTVMAHLMQEGFLLADPAAASGQPQGAVLPPYQRLPPLPYSPHLDLGALLCGYLRRFSTACLDTSSQAVSVLQVPASPCRICPNQLKPWHEKRSTCLRRSCMRHANAAQL